MYDYHLMVDNYDSKTKSKKQQGTFILDGSGTEICPLEEMLIGFDPIPDNNMFMFEIRESGLLAYSFFSNNKEQLLNMIGFIKENYMNEYEKDKLEEEEEEE